MAAPPNMQQEDDFAFQRCADKREFTRKLTTAQNDRQNERPNDRQPVKDRQDERVCWTFFQRNHGLQTPLCEIAWPLGPA